MISLTSGAAGVVRVVVADDSLTVRELLVSILESDPQVRVVGQARNGREALELARRLRPDIITMDIHMPVMDGIAATKEIMIHAPTPIVIVSSSANPRDVDFALDALSSGALMVLEKPGNPLSSSFKGRRDGLLSMVKAMSRVKVVRRRMTAPRVPSPLYTASVPAAMRKQVRLVTIVASTGGPAALQKVLSALPPDFPVPILVVQHIARGFIVGMADWLSRSGNLRVRVAQHGELLEPRTVYLAPDDCQLGVTAGLRADIRDRQPVGGFCPSGTYLFRSAALAAGSGVAAVVLTGMGRDGVDGLEAVKAVGGQVIAQDEQSSVVYGMPREAAVAGLVDVVLGLEGLGKGLIEIVATQRKDDAHTGR